MSAETIQKTCFVISPIGEEGSDTRRRADQVLKHLIKPAVAECGYSAVRADEIDKPGLITSQVIQCVVNDELVIADLSETNPNVFYELAIRHAIGKPLVQIIQKGERIPFDVGGMRTISFDHQDLDSVATARENIVSQIKELESNPEELETPISVSIELQKLRVSDNPDDRNYADLLAAVSDVRKDIRSLEFDPEEFESNIIEQINRISERRMDDRNPFLFDEMAPSYIHEMTLEQGVNPSNPIGIALIASMYRDIAPWVYEIGMEAYRSYVKAPKGKYNPKFLENFLEAAKRLTRSRYFHHILRANKKSMMALEMAQDLLFTIEHHPGLLGDDDQS